LGGEKTSSFELSGSELSQINVLLMFLLLFPKMKMFASRKLLEANQFICLVQTFLYFPIPGLFELPLTRQYSFFIF